MILLLDFLKLFHEDNKIVLLCGSHCPYIGKIADFRNNNLYSVYGEYIVDYCSVDRVFLLPVEDSYNRLIIHLKGDK